MLLQKLLSEIPTNWRARTTAEETEVDISSLAYDSRAVEKGSFFFAVEGMVTDGHLFLDQALSRGAVAVASEREPDDRFPTTWIQVPSIRTFMAQCSNQFFGNPSKMLRLVGVTGTNGKTTSCYLIHSIMNMLSPALRMGTIETVIGDEKTRTSMTTPEAPDIQRTLSRGVQQDCRHGVVEVSSHALCLQRVFECHFPVALFTNLSRDHLDFHQDLEEYFKAKQLLFKKSYNPGLEYTVTNGDDPFGQRLGNLSDGKSLSYGRSENSDFRLSDYRSTHEGLELTIKFFGRTLAIHSPLIGRPNLYNIMAAVTCCSLLGIPDETIQRGISSLKSVPGRFERVSIDAPYTIILDFAHTPDALGKVLNLAAEISQKRVICVFGCGGDLDPGKRPLMGRTAVEKADFVIITSDNPRSEDPAAIIHEIESGIPSNASNYESIVDRRNAIQRSIEVAERGDLILLAGKGHETHQEIDGKKYHFDEREILTEVLCLN